jgi:hypothetical protein
MTPPDRQLRDLIASPPVHGKWRNFVPRTTDDDYGSATIQVLAASGAGKAIYQLTLNQLEDPSGITAISVTCSGYSLRGRSQQLFCRLICSM